MTAFLLVFNCFNSTSTLTNWLRHIFFFFFQFHFNSLYIYCLTSWCLYKVILYMVMYSMPENVNLGLECSNARQKLGTEFLLGQDRLF